MRNFGASYKKIFGKEVEEEASLVDTVDVKQSFEGEENKESYETVPGTKEDARGKLDGSDNATVVTKSQLEEKRDLFKAIFLSSSENSDSEQEKDIDGEALKSVLISKVPSDVNVHRNTSPPRGIFAKVDLENLVSKTKTSESLDSKRDLNLISTPKLDQDASKEGESGTPEIEEVPMLENAYGPALPERLIKTENSSLPEASGSQSLEYPASRSKILGKWVEAGKAKKSKKEKRKHKHKEHKSLKHKRKSKRERRDS